jgi:hypothetical protein
MNRPNPHKRATPPTQAREDGERREETGDPMTIQHDDERGIGNEAKFRAGRAAADEVMRRDYERLRRLSVEDRTPDTDRVVAWLQAQLRASDRDRAAEHAAWMREYSRLTPLATSRQRADYRRELAYLDWRCRPMTSPTRRPTRRAPRRRRTTTTARSAAGDGDGPPPSEPAPATPPAGSSSLATIGGAS